MEAPLIDLEQVTVLADGRAIVDSVDWVVQPAERWVVLGANGSGKTTLLQVATAQRLPSRGRATVLGRTLGRTDMRELRSHIGFASSAVVGLLRTTLAARDAVMTAKYGALEPWWHDYDGADRARATDLLALAGLDGVGDRPIATLSQGERQRVVVARAFMPAVDLVVLDEPAAGLDLVSRELLVAQLDRTAADPAAPAMVLVTHHVEEIPAHATHLLLLRDGAVVARGPLETTLTQDALSHCLGAPLRLVEQQGRWSAWLSG